MYCCCETEQIPKINKSICVSIVNDNDKWYIYDQPQSKFSITVILLQYMKSTTDKTVFLTKLQLKQAYKFVAIMLNKHF